MLQNPEKPPNKIKSYSPISLLPIVSKLFAKLLLKSPKPIIKQFGLRNRHSTIDQVHQMMDIIEKALEEKNICSMVFLDVAHAFDKVWHKRLMSKLNKMLPREYVELVDFETDYLG